jgi:hypothetical protein
VDGLRLDVFSCVSGADRISCRPFRNHKYPWIDVASLHPFGAAFGSLFAFGYLRFATVRSARLRNGQQKNIAFLRQRNTRYLVGTQKAQLRDFEKALLENQDWYSVQGGLEARLIARPDGKGEEQYVLCRSTARAEKERAMLARQSEKPCAELQKIDTALREKPSIKAEAAAREPA